MTTVFKPHSLNQTPIDSLIASDASILSKQLQALRERIFPPACSKTASPIHQRRGCETCWRLRLLSSSNLAGGPWSKARHCCGWSTLVHLGPDQRGSAAPRDVASKRQKPILCATSPGHRTFAGNSRYELQGRIWKDHHGGPLGTKPGPSWLPGSRDRPRSASEPFSAIWLPT